MSRQLSFTKIEKELLPAYRQKMGSAESTEDVKKFFVYIVQELLNKAYAELEQKFEREPNTVEIAKLLKIDEADISVSIKNSGRHVSMDAPLLNEDENNLYDVLRSDESPSPEKSLIYDSLKIEIERAISTLTPREADVLRCYFGLDRKVPLSLEEIADKYELTRERVRQIKEKAIKRLKQTSRSKLLKTFLG